ncbi:MAG TPA: SusD/RagB family nutrient-binding outer membrane lipoprotein [Sphingobacteriaceae bacterium]|nr:SusD/RagB family nutrient-binding outer membrane lipoprotein [Sphingobacteriaceae bacterium]
MKKYNKIAILFMLIGVVGISQGCKDQFDLGENPNLVARPSINSLLSTSTQKAGLNTQRIASFNTFYSQYQASPTGGSAVDTYQITDNSSQWENSYYAMADLSDMIQLASTSGATEHLGVGQLLMAYTLGLVADTWGSAPYTDAFGLTVTLTPKYDSEEALYQTSLSLINESIVNLQKTTAPIRLSATSDLIHKGDREAWLRTAYGIQARFLNKISKKGSYSPAAVLAAVDKSYKANTQDATMGAFSGINPWAQLAVSNASNLLGGWLGENFINHLNGTTYGIVDPRIAKITDKTVTGTYVGTRNGRGNTGAANTIRDENYISVNSPVTSRTAPIFILTYPEIKFIEAEAALRSGPAGRVRAHAAYIEGIQAHMNRLEVPAAERDAYLATPSVKVDAATLTLGLIFKEKYVATYLSPEAWNDLRRNDYQYKDFKLPDGAVLTTFIRRVAYPITERSKNGSNVPAEVPLNTPLWWDKP